MYKSPRGFSEASYTGDARPPSLRSPGTRSSRKGFSECVVATHTRFTTFFSSKLASPVHSRAAPGTAGVDVVDGKPHSSASSFRPTCTDRKSEPDARRPLYGDAKSCES